MGSWLNQSEKKTETTEQLLRDNDGLEFGFIKFTGAEHIKFHTKSSPQLESGSRTPNIYIQIYIDIIYIIIISPAEMPFPYRTSFYPMSA